MFNFLKKIFSIFLIFNLTFVSSAQAAAAATFDNINGDGTGFDVSTQTVSPNGIAFNSDGTKMFLSDDDDDEINTYTLSTGFDLSTATYVNSFDISDLTSSPKGIAFNNDGTKMFVVNNGIAVGDREGDGQLDEVLEYTLSVGFDLTSTVAFVESASGGNGFSVQNKESNVICITFNNDGTKMFIVGFSGKDINVYTLSTGFDLTSTVSHVVEFDISDQEAAPMGVAFNNDGTRMFVSGTAGDDVNEYTLSVGFDLASIFVIPIEPSDQLDQSSGIIDFFV